MINWLFCPVCRIKLVKTAEGWPTCPDGHFTKYPTPVASTLAFIRHNNEYLVIKRARNPHKGMWDLPGGFAEYDETGAETILREICEETSLKNLTIANVIGAFPSTYGGTEKVLTVGYLIDSQDRDVKLSGENTEYQWLPLDKIPELAFEDCQMALRILQNDQ